MIVVGIGVVDGCVLHLTEIGGAANRNVIESSLLLLWLLLLLLLLILIQTC